ncbi:MAG: alkaline phosphatase family protein [Candidatus Eisenbacteria bacterium]|nr:alkaline phosphatase family protein [Candidatus Eisenbacteria bacterium]
MSDTRRDSGRNHPRLEPRRLPARSLKSALLLTCSIAAVTLFALLPASAARAQFATATPAVNSLVAAIAATPAEGDLLAAGPMPAGAALRSATIWLQTKQACSVELRYGIDGSGSAAGETGTGGASAPMIAAPAQATTLAGEHIAVFELDDLEPGTTYRYELRLDGALVERPYPFTFKTQPLWEWRTDPPTVTVMIGSCFYVNEEQYDRPGKPYGSEHEILGPMAAVRPDLMIWLGDNTYLREVDYFSPGGIRGRYRHTRSFPGLQPFLASTHHYATWDDHDFGPNDSDGSYPLKAQALETFSRYWPAPNHGVEGAPGVFQRFRWADIDFFLLDDRYHRKPNRWPAGPDKRMLGLAQMNWLKEGLVSSDATWKVVALGNQVLNDVGRFETFGRYPEERKELLDWIVGQKIDGVVFISGDRHRSELTRVEPPGGYPLYDFTSSSITAGIANLKEDDAEWSLPNRVEGTLLLEHSFGLMRFSGPRKERVVTFSAMGKDGTLRWERSVARTELSSAKN